MCRVVDKKSWGGFKKVFWVCVSKRAAVMQKNLLDAELMQSMTKRHSVLLSSPSLCSLWATQQFNTLTHTHTHFIQVRIICLMGQIRQLLEIYTEANTCSHVLSTATVSFLSCSLVRLDLSRLICLIFYVVNVNMLLFGDVMYHHGLENYLIFDMFSQVPGGSSVSFSFQWMDGVLKVMLFCTWL